MRIDCDEASIFTVFCRVTTVFKLRHEHYQPLFQRQTNNLHQLEGVGRCGDAWAQGVVEVHGGAISATCEGLGEVDSGGGRREFGRVSQREIVGRDRAHRCLSEQVIDDAPRRDLALGRVRAVQDLVQQEQQRSSSGNLRGVGFIHDTSQPLKFRHEIGDAALQRILDADAGCQLHRRQPESHSADRSTHLSQGDVHADRSQQCALARHVRASHEQE